MQASSSQRQTIEYKFLPQNLQHSIPKMRFSAIAYLAVFQVVFIVLYGFFASYKAEEIKTVNAEVPKLYSMFMDVHSMMFIGFGFLMTFLKRYGYGSVGFNFIIAAYVLEWSLLVRGWISEEGMVNAGRFSININSLLVADFCAAAVLISFGAVIGKASLSQLIIMATVEVVLQSANEYIGLHYLHAYDIGESMYVHIFGAYFGLAVSKMLHHREIESSKESSHYHSDLFSLIGTIFLWLYWPSFNSACAQDEGQRRAIINTYLSLTASCITTFVVSLLLGKGRLNMVHIQNATLAGGVAVGAIADMVIYPFGALIVGSLAGIVSTLGFEYLTPMLKRMYLHDTCGVNNLHGIPGIMSGIAAAIVAAFATREVYNNDRLYTFYPSRLPAVNSTEYYALKLNENKEFKNGGMGRSAALQSGYQFAALFMSLGIALVGGVLTGLFMRLPIFEQIRDEKEMFDDEPHWITPEDYSLKLSEVTVHPRGGGDDDDGGEEKHLKESHT